METNHIYQGDCLEVMTDFPNDYIDLTVTSPPYDSLREYHGYEFNFEATAKELYRVTKQGGVVVWVVGDATINGSETGTSFRQALYFMECGFNLHDTMIWNKGKFSNPSNNRYYQVFEYMFILSKEKPKTFNPIKDRLNIRQSIINPNGVAQTRQKDGSMKPMSTIRKKPNKFGQRFNIWFNGPQQYIDHPAPFPERLARDYIISWSDKGDLVLDPFCGSGTTCKMAIENHREYIGIEISEEYCEIAKRRVRNTVPGLHKIQKPETEHNKGLGLL